MMCMIFVQPITSNFFTAIGKPKKGIFLSLTRQFIFLIPLIIALPLIFGFEGLLYAQPIADLLACAICIVMAVREFRKPEYTNAEHFFIFKRKNNS
jgi:Na+-driven multidrug efflux pump